MIWKFTKIKMVAFMLMLEQKNTLFYYLVKIDIETILCCSTINTQWILPKPLYFPHGSVMLMIMACIYVPDGVSLPSTIDLASSLLIDGLGHMHEGISIEHYVYTFLYIVIFFNSHVSISHFLEYNRPEYSSSSKSN